MSSRFFSLLPILAVAFVSGLFCSVVALSEPGQALATELTGTVIQEGAVISNARVTVKNQDTGLTRTTTTDDGGRYRLSGLPPGTYTITCEVSGFQTWKSTSVRLGVGASMTLDIDLGVQPIVSEPVMGEIRGTVLENNGKPVAGARVEIKTGDEYSYHEKTDSEGAYSRAGLTPGLYTIYVEADGFLPSTKKVSLGKRSTKKVDFKLRRK